MLQVVSEAMLAPAGAPLPICAVKNSALPMMKPIHAEDLAARK
jgi:hypothetical protein